LSYKKDGTPEYMIACCLLKEEISGGWKKRVILKYVWGYPVFGGEYNNWGFRNAECGIKVGSATVPTNIGGYGGPPYFTISHLDRLDYIYRNTGVME
jgi:hypothetical protein